MSAPRAVLPKGPQRYRGAASWPSSPPAFTPSSLHASPWRCRRRGPMSRNLTNKNKPDACYRLDPGRPGVCDVKSSRSQFPKEPT
ncbi:protein of unknown function [Ralstonia solanacearum CMR15]|nr:protein of unknown function [Ralstonia solanacearum CMR15]